MLHLADDVIAELVEPAAAERAVWAAFAAWGRGTATTTQRVRAISADGMASAMAAVVPPYCGGKLYATAAGRFTFVNVLFHTDGRVLATLDGDAITRLRTPGASSLALHHLAAPGASIATVIGAGVQSWSHVQMLQTARPALAELRICDLPGLPHAERLAARAREIGLPAVAVHDATTAVDGAQVVVTITPARQPLFPAEVVADDAVICAVGATKHDRAEIGADVIERCATVVCDDVAGSRAECGDLVQAAGAGRFDWGRAVELHTVAAGTVTCPRAGSAPVLFETQGVAIQDVAVAALAYERFTGAIPERSTA
jgi:ornithine cyclodeaminase